MEDIAPRDQAFALRLLADMYSSFTFDPELIAALLIDLRKRGMIKDSRKGIREIDFSRAFAYNPNRYHL